MKWTTKSLLSALLVSTASAADTSLCDLYTGALLKNNTAANQYTLLTLVVNTALIGNYTKPNVGIKVNGILVPGTYNGKNVTLLPYFNGGLLSTNRGGKGGVAVNFIDGGGAIPLALNMAADTDKTNSNQYRLLTHLYSYFGRLLGCSHYDQMGFPAYNGSAKMYELHKHMNLDPNEMGYFIQEVGLSAASFGVSKENVTYIGNALSSMFNVRCAPPAPLLPGDTADLQAMCINSACPVATAGAVCSNYNSKGGVGVDPSTASSTIGPQLTALAAQLSSISAGSVTPAGSTPTGGAMVTTITTGSSTIVSTIMSSAPSVVTSSGTTSVATVITSLEVTGGSTVTSLISTSTGVATVVTSTVKPNAAPMQTAAMGMMAVAGAAGVIGQMW